MTLMPHDAWAGLGCSSDIGALSSASRQVLIFPRNYCQCALSTVSGQCACTQGQGVHGTVSSLSTITTAQCREVCNTCRTYPCLFILRHISSCEAWPRFSRLTRGQFWVEAKEFSLAKNPINCTSSHQLSGLGHSDEADNLYVHLSWRSSRRSLRLIRV